jgi:hypothetical protein
MRTDSCGSKRRYALPRRQRGEHLSEVVKGDVSGTAGAAVLGELAFAHGEQFGLGGRGAPVAVSVSAEEHSSARFEVTAQYLGLAYRASLAGQIGKRENSR